MDLNQWLCFQSWYWWQFFKHLLRAYGSPNETAPSFAQCRGPREVGFELTFGDIIGSPERTDIENANVWY